MTAESLIVLDLIVVAVTGLAMLAARGLVEVARTRLGPLPDPVPARLDRYELAYLSGGPRRVADTALVALSTPPGECIRISRGGRVRGTVPAGPDDVRPTAVAPASVPVEQVVTEPLAAAASGWIHTGPLRTAVESSAAMEQLRQRLVDRRLLSVDGMQRWVRLWLKVQNIAAIGATLGFLLTVVAVTAATTTDYFVGAFLGLAPIGMLAALAAYSGMTRADTRLRELPYAPTRAGSAALLAAAKAGQREPALRLALHGLEDLRDRELEIRLSQQDLLPHTSQHDTFTGADREAAASTPMRDLHRPMTGRLMVALPSPGTVAPIRLGAAIVAMLQLYDLPSGPTGWDILDRDENPVAGVAGTAGGTYPVQLRARAGHTVLTQELARRFLLPDQTHLKLSHSRRKLQVRDTDGTTVATVEDPGRYETGDYHVVLHEPVLSIIQAAGLAQMYRQNRQRAHRRNEALRRANPGPAGPA